MELIERDIMNFTENSLYHIVSLHGFWQHSQGQKENFLDHISLQRNIFNSLRTADPSQLVVELQILMKCGGKIIRHRASKQPQELH